MSTDDIWNSFFGNFESLNRRMEDIFSRMESEGADVKTYGYTVYQGPDGVRHVREYGNSGNKPLLSTVKEPYTDVTSEDGIIRVVAEIPGVKKEDVNLECFGNSLSIRVDNGDKKYFKEIPLPSEADPASADAVYNNGLLEVTLKSLSAKPKGTRIDIR